MPVSPATRLLAAAGVGAEDLVEAAVAAGAAMAAAAALAGEAGVAAALAGTQVAMVEGILPLATAVT